MSDWDAATENRYQQHRQAYLCAVADLHPYECGGPGGCPHCDRTVSDEHDPATCELCDTERLEREARSAGT